MSITLQDVAKLAGVSIGTASQALNNNPKVALETSRRVIDAARTLGYVMTERQHMSPKTANLSVIGVLAKHDIGDITLVNPFYSHIYAGIEAECRRLGIGLMFSNIEVDLNNRPLEWPAMLNNKLVKGLIFVGTQIEETAQLVKQHLNIPVILIDSYSPNLPFDSVLTDNVQGAELALKHLVELGHRHIGLIGSRKNSVPSIADRRKGYVQAMKLAGTFNENYIEDSDLNRPAASEATNALLNRASEITAIFVCNDDCASAVLAVLAQQGLKVPEDISVIGFDNIPLASELSPSLTTVHVHKNWMGILGLRLLIERAENPEKPKTTNLIATQLVVRHSTAPPRTE
jgi:DNA-binding LacI/PurR family transcriptional regulator